MGSVHEVIEAFRTAPSNSERGTTFKKLMTLNRRVADLVLMRVKTRSTSEKGPMPSFDIDVTRDGGWWAVHIPELGGLTQARYPSEVEPMAREYIAVSTGTAVDQVAINWRRCTLQPR